MERPSLATVPGRRGGWEAAARFTGAHFTGAQQPGAQQSGAQQSAPYLRAANSRRATVAPQAPRARKINPTGEQ